MPEFFWVLRHGMEAAIIYLSVCPTRFELETCSSDTLLSFFFKLTIPYWVAYNYQFNPNIKMMKKKLTIHLYSKWYWSSCSCMQVARVILFVYFFAHVYLHFDQVIIINQSSSLQGSALWQSVVKLVPGCSINLQVRTVFPLGFYSMMAVPPAMSAMNLLWFRKICKGMVKAMSSANRSQCVKTD